MLKEYSFPLIPAIDKEDNVVTNIFNRPEEVIYTVSHLNQTAHFLLENQLGWIKVQGEISNLKRASSGHYYFSLKDNTCQVNCVLFASYAQSVTSLLENGKQVLAIAKVGLYQPRGDYQLNIRQLEDAGVGLLQMEFNRLKKRLAEQGLFDAQFKRSLPITPHVVGVVTSPHGAAIRDILATLKRRFIAAKIIIYPTEVQGKTAAPKIAKAIQIANERNECDVLIVARGGGSVEDLWPFNEEIVAWAIFNSELPIVTGIGHQIDTTIADYVADHVASTPTAAAESVAPNQKDWLQQTQHCLNATNHSMRYYLSQKRQNLSTFENKLQQFKYSLQEKWQTLDRLNHSLNHTLYQLISRKKTHLNQLNYILNKKNPLVTIQQSRAQFTSLTQKLQQIWQKHMQKKQQRFAACITALRVVSPLATLERGYALAMTHNETSSKILREPEDIQPNEKIVVKLAKMQLLCKVEEITCSKI